MQRDLCNSRFQLSAFSVGTKSSQLTALIRAGEQSEPRTDAEPGHEAFAPDRFERTPSTWLAYLLVGYFMYVQASLGPILPFLREDLSLGYGAAGLHFGAFALGVLFTGLLGDRPARLLARRTTLWGAAASLSATLITGFCARLLLMSAQAALSDLHGEWRAAAISEANVVAGVAAILAPLVVGAFSRTEFPGWRGALLFATLLLAALALTVTVDRSAQRHEKGGD